MSDHKKILSSSTKSHKETASPLALDKGFKDKILGPFTAAAEKEAQPEQSAPAQSFFDSIESIDETRSFWSRTAPKNPAQACEYILEGLTRFHCRCGDDVRWEFGALNDTLFVFYLLFQNEETIKENAARIIPMLSAMIEIIDTEGLEEVAIDLEKLEIQTSDARFFCDLIDLYAQKNGLHMGRDFIRDVTFDDVTPDDQDLCAALGDDELIDYCLPDDIYVSEQHKFFHTLALAKSVNNGTYMGPVTTHDVFQILVRHCFEQAYDENAMNKAMPSLARH